MKLKKASILLMAAMMAMGFVNTALAEETATPADDEIVDRVYTLENAMDTKTYLKCFI